jgi:hypothetical protein
MTSQPSEPQNGSSKPQPCPLQQELEALVEAGDLHGLLEKLLHVDNVRFNLLMPQDWLYRAVEAASERSPAAFSGAVFRETAAFLTYVQLRLQILAMRRLNDQDAAGGYLQNKLADDLTETILPQWREMAALTAELNQLWATTARRWELVLAKREERQARRRQRQKSHQYNLGGGMN